MNSVIKFFIWPICFFWVGMLPAQTGETVVPKLWLKDSHGLRDFGKLNDYSSLYFLEEVKVLTKKNIMGRYNSIYSVYKSTEKDSVSLFTFLNIPNYWHISTNQIVTPTENKITRGNLDSGVILNFSFTAPDKGVRNDYFFMNNQYDHGKTAIYEVLVYNKSLSEVNKKRIETYLSLKYGISLYDSSRYISTDERPLWDVKLNPNYQKQILGIGRSDEFDWHQTTTVHSQDDSVRFSIISDKTQTVPELKDETYVLWGHNGRGMDFKESVDGMEYLQRAWMVQVHGVSDPTEITMVLPDLNEQEYWLYINRDQPQYGFSNTERYLGVVKDSTQLVFSGIVWDSDRNGYDYFTLGRKAKFEFKSKVIAECFDLNSVEIEIKGGTAPYKVSLQRANQEAVVTVFDTDRAVLKEVKGGVYQLDVQEALGETASSELSIDKDPIVQIRLDKQWVLHGKTQQVTLRPKVINTQGVLLDYQWTKDGELLSRLDHLSVNTVGNYQLKVRDKQGCEKRFDTEVVKTTSEVDASQRWTIYPNPTKSGESFEVHFDLSGISQVVLYTYTLDGKYVNRRDLGSIQTQTVSHKINEPGVYLLVAIIQGKTEIKKLVVQ